MRVKLLELSTYWQAGTKLGAGYALLFATYFPVGFANADAAAAGCFLHHAAALTVRVACTGNSRAVVTSATE